MFIIIKELFCPNSAAALEIVMAPLMFQVCGMYIFYSTGEWELGENATLINF